MILETIADNYLWFLIMILFTNFYQKRQGSRSLKKRTATLIIAIYAMVWQIFIVVILTRDLPHWLAIVALGITLLAMYPVRNRVLIFKTHCVECGEKLNFHTTLNYDDNLCDSCWAKAHPEQAPEKPEEKEPEVIETAPLVPVDARTVEEIDWDSWEPTETAVLCYLFDDDKVLLIHKKTGLGKGLVNAPGGHIEAYETAREAAMREITEETGVVVDQVEYRGLLEFQFIDGLAMRGHIFFAYHHTGEIIETDEATPFWCPVSDLPYDQMWEDDPLWLPMALEGKEFVGRFIFDGERMLSSHVVEVERQGE
jgi:8-oxo-dGTP diphosphatase